MVLQHVADYFSKEVIDELDTFSDEASTQSTPTSSCEIPSPVGNTNHPWSDSSRSPSSQKKDLFQTSTWPLPTRPTFGRSVSEPKMEFNPISPDRSPTRHASFPILDIPKPRVTSPPFSILGAPTLLVQSPKSSPLSNQLICDNDEIESRPTSKPVESRIDTAVQGGEIGSKSRLRTKFRSKFEGISTVTKNTEKETLRKGIMAHQRNDMTLSAVLFERCAKENGGTGVGMLMWALALRHGWGCPVDTSKAFGWLQLSIETLLLELHQSKLEKQRYDELHSLQKSGKDPVFLRYLISEIKGIKSELLLGLYELGQCLMHGWGCQRDKELAVQYYRMAANLGDEDAQKELAYCYEVGNGVKKSSRNAAKYYRMASERGIKMMGYQWIWKEKYNPNNP